MSTRRAKDKSSSFAMTCNRLSLFLKEKKGNILIPHHLHVKEKSTVDLLSNMNTDSPLLTKTEKSMNISRLEEKDSQMTIFYGGQVFVFDCIPGDKARDMMSSMFGVQESEDLPIARRASLHKFLSKRRHRPTPYQLQHSNPMPLSFTRNFDLNV